MKTILVTGSSGFVGSNLMYSFRKCYRMIGVDIPNKNFDSKYYEIYDWNQLHLIPDSYAIIHLAGKSHDLRKETCEQEYYDVNVGLTKKIFRQYLDSSTSKFVFFSSVKASADSVENKELTENFLADPKTIYGKSKLEAENYILNEFSKWKENEKSMGKDSEWKKVYILRPCMIHGPGNKGNLNLLYKFSQKNIPWPLGGYINKRSFCSISNIIYVVKELIEKNIDPGLYQVADDEAISTIELINLMASSQNKKVKIWYISPKIVNNISIVGDLFHLPFNSEKLKKLTETYIVSNTKLKSALGISKMPITAISGIESTLEFFKKDTKQI